MEFNFFGCRKMNSKKSNNSDCFIFQNRSSKTHKNDSKQKIKFCRIFQIMTILCSNVTFLCLKTIKLGQNKPKFAIYKIRTKHNKKKF